MHNYSIIVFIFAALLHKYTSMSTKKERLDAICRIIQTEKIGNQEELLKQLENSGFQVTQATLSRDIKQLKVIKVHDGDGNYVYRLPDYSALMQPVKEQIHTIPISDAFDNAGECPFCYIEKRTEDHVMDFVLGHGASYMEADIRDMTDKEGFCRAHFKKMFDYGNSLGNAWILKTMYMRHIEEMDKEFKNFKPDSVQRSGLFKKANASSNSIVDWINKRESTCFICDSVNKTFNAYMKTFFTMYEKDPELKEKLKNTKGFCLDHLKVVLEGADTYLKGDKRKEFYDIVLPLMHDNMNRIYEDVAWFIEKYDYKNKDADWKNSKDAIQRGMQKLRGSDPSLPPHVLKK